MEFAPLTPIGNSYDEDGNAATSGGKGLFPHRGVYTHGMIQLVRYFLFSSPGKEMATIPLQRTDFVVLHVLASPFFSGQHGPDWWPKQMNCTVRIM